MVLWGCKTWVVNVRGKRKEKVRDVSSYSHDTNPLINHEGPWGEDSK
jgi:hypothetical protein